MATCDCSLRTWEGGAGALVLHLAYIGLCTLGKMHCAPSFVSRTPWERCGVYITRRKTCAEHLGQRKTDRERETKVIMRESEAAIQFMVLRPQKTPNIHNEFFEL